MAKTKHSKFKEKIGKLSAIEWWENVISYRQSKKFDPAEYKKMDRRRIGVGSMLAYKYDAKGKDKLQFWDKNPLVVIFGETGRHFIGINIHYIHPKFRPIFLQKVVRINRLRIKNDRRFHLEWRDIKRFIYQHNLKISIRKYIKGRMSTIQYIKGKDWKYAARLPSERFVFNGNMDRDKLYKLIAKTGRKS